MPLQVLDLIHLVQNQILVLLESHKRNNGQIHLEEEEDNFHFETIIHIFINKMTFLWANIDFQFNTITLRYINDWIW